MTFRQMAAGAVGICCAKLGEAEALGGGGIENILVTSPVVTPQAITRLIALNEAIAELMVVVDHPDNVEALSMAAEKSGKLLTVVVDIDPGMSRTGIRPEGAVALVRFVAESNTLEYAGLQCYAGSVQHLEEPKERREKSLAAMAELGALRDRHVPLYVIFGVFAGLALVSVAIVLAIRPRPELDAKDQQA